MHHAAIFGDGPDAAEHDDGDHSYDGLGDAEARSRRRADAVAVQAADAIGADIYVTLRPYLHAVTWDLAPGVMVATPDDVLPLISLYLRTQGEFITYRSFDGTASSRTTKGMFYWIGVREFLPAGWRWFAACVQHRERDNEIIYLAQSAFRRVQRALEARDDVLRALNQPQDNDTATDALANLDLALLALMGAVDVTARVAHRTLRLTGTERVAGWQNKTWLRQVKKSDPDLADAFAPGSRHRRALSILGVLRNSIHGAALSPLAVSDRGRRHETLVGLPHDAADDLVAEMEHLGGRELWGVSELLPGGAHADPGVLIDRVIVCCVELLDDVMRLTPVELLDDVVLTDKDLYPPSGDEFDEHVRTTIRWQLGLDPGGVAPVDSP